MSQASSLLSTYLHPTISTVEDLVYRTKSLLGSPVQDDEMTDGQWLEIVSEALENYTTWGAGAKEEYLIFCSNQYRRGCGVKLDELVQVGCNTQFCNQTVVVSSVTSDYWDCELVETKTAYLSVSPFIYPTDFDVNDPNSVEFKGISGQKVRIQFDPSNPWNATNVCNADCLVINPVSSQYFQLTVNPNLTGLTLDFLNNSTLTAYSYLIPEDVVDPLSAIPFTSLGNNVSGLPISTFDLSAFYPPTFYDHPPMEACVDICGGYGYLYPQCDLNSIDACAPLSSFYNISPTYTYILTSLVLSSYTIEDSSNSVEYSAISSYFELFCNSCACGCSLQTLYTTASADVLVTENNFYLTTEDYNFLAINSSETSSITFEIIQNIISGADGQIWPMSALNIANATHVILNNIPSCVNDGLIPINFNNGIFPTVTLCNTAVCTEGPMYLENVQFVHDYKPPVEILYDSCTECPTWTNNGFTFSHPIDSHVNCSRTTPEKVKVDVSFYRKNLVTEVGEVSTYYSSKYDALLDRPRKVYGVFSMDNANSSGSFGGFGGDMLFNFDYALLASTFGYNMQGSRINAGMGYDLVTYHLARSFVENTKRLLRNVSYTWDEHTQYLKIQPEPPINMQADGDDVTCCGSAIIQSSHSQCYMVGVYLEAPVQELLASYWVREYVLARAKQVLGTMRAKYSNVSLYGGAGFDAASLLQEGSKRIEELMKELRQDNYYTSPPSMFIG